MFRGGVLANNQSLLHNGEATSLELVDTGDTGEEGNAECGQLKPFMRIVLDEMVEDPDPIRPSSQGTVVDADQTQVIVDWDEDVHRSLHLIPGVDKFHILDSHNPDEMRRSWENLRNIQTKAGRLTSGLSSRCPRCGREFDVRRGAVSRAVTCCNISICSSCGYQEAIEQFLIHGKEMGCDVEVSVPEGLNKTGFPTESENKVSSDLDSHSINTDDIDNEKIEGEQEKREKLKIRVLPLSEWYIVRIWTGTYSEDDVVIEEVAKI